MLYAINAIVSYCCRDSFLAGEPVHFAGEVQVQAGALQVITSKSGHYKPTTTQLAAMLRFLQVNQTSEQTQATDCITLAAMISKISHFLKTVVLI